jgi:RNA polymerase sigma-70 factor (ECF subfamily)
VIGLLLMPTSLPRFEILIERHHDEIYTYLWRLLDGAAYVDRSTDAHDLTQEVFLRAYRAFPRLRTGSNPRAWLYKIATNCAYTLLKRSRGRLVDTLPVWDEADDIPASDPSLDDLASLGESLRALQDVVTVLPPRQQAALLMRYVQGLEYTEVADALGCSEEAARANVYQAIRRLRSLLSNEANVVKQE